MPAEAQVGHANDHGVFEASLFVNSFQVIYRPINYSLISSSKQHMINYNNEIAVASSL